MKQATCRFCGSATQLRKSHIIPAFVLRWLKETSPGAIRSAQTVNRRVQDGVKSELLCDACEQTFSSWEKPFAERFFFPFHEGTTDFEEISYGAWALKFAVSVSWRVLTFFHEINDTSHLSVKELQEAMSALEHWKRFLKGNEPHPGRFEQHLIPLNLIESMSSTGGIRWSSFLNRYLSRSIDIDVAAFDHSALVYSKLGRLLLIGFITGERRSSWKGTRIRVSEGRFGEVRQFGIPGHLVHFINQKASRYADTLTNMSPNQKALIEQAFREKARSGELFETEIFEAIQRDGMMFGEEAFPAGEDTE